MRRLFVPVAPGAVQVCSRRCRSAEFQHAAKSSAFSIADVHPLAALSPRSAVTIPIQASPPLASPPPPRPCPRCLSNPPTLPNVDVNVDPGTHQPEHFHFFHLVSRVSPRQPTRGGAASDALRVVRPLPGPGAGGLWRRQHPPEGQSRQLFGALAAVSWSVYRDAPSLSRVCCQVGLVVGMRVGVPCTCRPSVCAQSAGSSWGIWWPVSSSSAPNTLL